MTVVAENQLRLVITRLEAHSTSVESARSKQSRARSCVSRSTWIASSAARRSEPIRKAMRARIDA